MIYLLIGSAVILLSLKAVDTVQGLKMSMSDNWTRFDALFQKYGRKFNVNWKYLKAIAMNESSLGSVASVARGLEVPIDVEGSKSQDGKSWGLMQVTLGTAKDFDSTATAINLNNPEYSIKLAARYLAHLQGRFNMLEMRWLEYVIKSYNQGPGNTEKERKGLIKGYAEEYWSRFQRNLERVG